MRKIWKQAAAGLCAAALAATSLAGCGQSASSTAASEAASGSGSTASGETAEPVTLEFWTIALQPTFTDFLNGLIDKYEAENPGVTINWVDLPYDSIQQKLVTATAGGTSPDVVNLNTQMTLTLAGKGALVDLEKEATEEQKSVYVPSLYDSARIGDSVYAFPWYASPNIMFYNKALFEQAGLDISTLPTQYREAFDAAKTMKEKTGAYLYNPPEFFNLLFEEGIPILNDDNTAAAFNTSETVDLLNSFKELTDQDILPKNSKWGDWDTELKLFETGQLAIVSSSGSSLSRIKDEAPDVYNNIGVAAPLTGSEGFSRNALMNLVVPEASKHHEEAIKFAAYITGDECQLEFCKQTAIFPSTIKAGQDPYFTSDSETLEGQARMMSVEVSDTSKDYSLGTAGQSEIQDAVNQIQEAVIQNGTDTQTALDNGEKAVNDILAQTTE